MATHYRTCPFCEATCGLEIETEGREVVSVRGDADDVFSRGFICPKAYGVKQLHEDPDRLTVPLVRRDGELVEATWDEAFEEIDRRLSPILSEHGRNAVAVYLGNPNAHNLSAITHGPAWLRVLGSQQVYTASTVDQMPKQVSSGLMFGTMLSVPIPDVDRCDHLLLLGANPLVSNGSLLTAPNMRSASAAGRSSWSIRAGRAPPRRRASITSSGRARTRCSWPRSHARSSRRGSTRWARWSIT
jgi:anaerobic selenocysteine-containing dehydrogenase